MLTRSPSTRAIAFALAFTVAAISLIMFTWHRFGGALPMQAKSYRVHVFFDQAQNLQPNADVRMAGVTIGKVASVKTTTRRTEAVFDIKSRYAPLHEGVRVMTRVKTLLGETFVAVAPGPPGAKPIPDGGTVPLGNIAQTQQLDEVLGAFDARTRTALRRYLEETDAVFDGRATDLNSTLAHLGPVSEDLDVLANSLDADEPALTRFVDRTGVMFDAIARRPRSLRNLITAADQTLQTTSDVSDGLRRSIDALGPLQRELRTSTESGLRTGRVARPILRTLRPATPHARAAFSGGRDLANALNGLFEAQIPALRASRKGLPATVEVNDATRRVFGALLSPARDILPIIELATAYRRDIVSGFASYAAALQGTAPDASGVRRHFLKSVLTFNNETNGKTAARIRFNRHNAYPRPGWLERLAGGLESSDCDNANDPAVAVELSANGAPPCKVQGGWTFKGSTRYYPLLKKAP